jgi:hypothetical protein
VAAYLGQYRDYELVVKIGTLEHHSVARVTQQFVWDAESALIVTNQPLFNRHHRNRHSGRTIHVTNNGDYAPLRRVADVHQGDEVSP